MMPEVTGMDIYEELVQSKAGSVEENVVHGPAAPLLTGSQFLESVPTVTWISHLTSPTGSCCPFGGGQLKIDDCHGEVVDIGSGGTVVR